MPRIFLLLRFVKFPKTHIAINFYRSQTKFAKVMFLHLSVCHSVHRGCLPQCMLGYTPPGADTPWSKQLSPGANTPPPRSSHPPSSACWEIRPTSGRYASYWNAYLLFKVSICINLHEIVRKKGQFKNLLW